MVMTSPARGEPASRVAIAVSRLELGVLLPCRSGVAQALALGECRSGGFDVVAPLSRPGTSPKLAAVYAPIAAMARRASLRGRGCAGSARNNQTLGRFPAAPPARASSFSADACAAITRAPKVLVAVVEMIHTRLSSTTTFSTRR